MIERLRRHLRLTRQARRRDPQPTPPFLILFINSICNQACDHCFYWQSLNRKDDLTVDEMFALGRSLGRIDNLNLSGGEPFLRKELAEICRFFVRNNGVQRIYCPTNGSFGERTVAQLQQLFEEPDLLEFTVEMSLDGMPDFHDAFRHHPGAFAKAIETYDMLEELQRREPRLQIHAISTATGENIDEIKRLSTFLHDRCPAMNHHNIAMLRGERKRPTLVGPELLTYRDLVDYVARLWRDREAGRLGAIVDPMLHWGKEKIARAQSQAIPCRAGILSGVVYANGDVSVCEQHAPLGNLRERSFPEIWNSPKARELRESIACKQCFCTNEVFLWSSIVFQPWQLAKALLGGKVWRKPKPLRDGEKVGYELSSGAMTSEPGSLRVR